ncbi:hypothetical protein AURANDRAFT_61725 [Aureococcus anophagefferens]|uniref:Uncharacterized protein n=1 Tax=Aureococcus anophagefferens TaxID=44056 RepID=F0XZE7_AURAN|nr:hypothetical protein AURANDRAFT_61725 [Aureococcus anophagefferens]EGB11624.1 hypothetical protein AURANDRAFT_61725 [Aureococcus anophagefferens]|eukprot:XP_009033972.1 hypothetical protein AURANDRAFT_61725 [Aureococcus anophagefferens]
MVAIHANALNLMAQRGETTALQRAIDQGADVNEVDHDWFPLMMAVAVNQPSVVSLLLRNGAEQELAELLLVHGADVDGADVRGTCGLHAAVYFGRPGLVRLFLAHGADPNRATVSVEEARPPPFDASPGKPMRSAVDDPSSLKLPPGFTPLRLATAATAAENSVFGDDAPPADFPSDGGEQQEKRRRRIADELLGAGATEPLDAWDLEGADSVARWFAALSWHGAKTTDGLVARVLEATDDYPGGVDAAALFALDERELDDLLDVRGLAQEHKRPETADSSLSTARTTRSAAKLWYRKVQRHALLQRDRAHRGAVGAALGDEASPLREPLDNEDARATIVARLRGAAGAYTKATAVAGGSPALEDVDRALDGAAAAAEAELERLARARGAARAGRYEALVQRWYALRRAVDAARDGTAAHHRAEQPHPADAPSWWDAAAVAATACPFDAADGEGARAFHVRARCGAARPILYGALQGLVDEVNAAAHPAQLGLSGADFPLPFADEPFLRVDGGRCALVAKPSKTPEELKWGAGAMAARDAVAATILAEDPYVVAVVLALLATRGDTLPLRLCRVAADLDGGDRAATVVANVMAVYPATPEAHAKVTAAPPPENPLPDGADDDDESVGLEPVPPVDAEGETPEPERGYETARLVPARAGGPTFAPDLAGADLALGEVTLALATLHALDAFAAPYADALAAPDAADRRRALFSRDLPFLDGDAWLLKTPPDVADYRRRQGAALHEEMAELGDAARCAALEERLGAAAAAAAVARAAAARAAEGLEAELKQRDMELEGCHAALERATASLAARSDEVFKLKEEVARLRAASVPDSPRDAAPAAPPPKPPKKAAPPPPVPAKKNPFAKKNLGRVAPEGMDQGVRYS